jgi:protocatechuate 3,4-dioxygenase beta subunit
MTFITRSAGTVALLLTLTSLASASLDQRFLQMWYTAQELKPANLISVARIAPLDEPGTPLIVHGLVLDTNGRPAAGVEVFAYHTDRTGHYAAEGATDPWRLKGWAVTDANGRFEFRTIRPEMYPSRNTPAHIHATLTTSCCGHQFDDLMFEDDPLATPAFRDHYAEVGEHGLYAPVTRNADGTESVSYTIRIREHGNF